MFTQLTQKTYHKVLAQNVVLSWYYLLQEADLDCCTYHKVLAQNVVLTTWYWLRSLYLPQDIGSDHCTYHRVLTQIVVRSSCYCVELHQILKVTDLSLHPFLQKKRECGQTFWTFNSVLNSCTLLQALNTTRSQTIITNGTVLFTPCIWVKINSVNGDVSVKELNEFNTYSLCYHIVDTKL